MRIYAYIGIFWIKFESHPISSRTTWWSDFAACSAMEIVQELYEVPRQVRYK